MPKMDGGYCVGSAAFTFFRNLCLNAQNKLITRLVYELMRKNPLPVKQICEECGKKGITAGVATNAIIKLSKNDVLSIDTKTRSVQMTDFGKWICDEKLGNLTLEDLVFKYAEKKDQKSLKNKTFRDKKKNENS